METSEYATASVPASIWKAKPRHLEDLGDVNDEVLGLIRSGRAYLKLVAYPWGVEFDLCEKEDPT